MNNDSQEFRNLVAFAAEVNEIVSSVDRYSRKPSKEDYHLLLNYLDAKLNSAMAVIKTIDPEIDLSELE